MKKAKTNKAVFECPFCHSQEIYSVNRTDGTYECAACEERTHEKIIERWDDLEYLAETDLPIADLAGLLIQKND